jgi:hypothetical protein
MATFYLRTRTGLACKKAGRKHALYIAGKDRYSDKTEVQFVIDGNLPLWAKNADEFFVQADDNERANGRSYRSVVFAIPNEAVDKCLWAQEFTQTLLGSKHAYRLAVHIPQNQHNPHAHLMFTERGQTDMPAETYFGRKNVKSRAFSGSKSKQWLAGAKSQYLALIGTICPTYTPQNKEEQKIGPILIGAGSEYEIKRLQRQEDVLQLRAWEQELNDVSIAIESQEVSLIFPLQQRVPIDGILNKADFKPSSRIVNKHLQTAQSTPLKMRFR